MANAYGRKEEGKEILGKHVGLGASFICVDINFYSESSIVHHHSVVEVQTAKMFCVIVTTIVLQLDDGSGKAMPLPLNTG